MKKLCFFLLLIVPLFGMTQVADDFTDGNFTANPTWVGDIECFEVNTSGQLHLHATGSDTAILTTQNSLIANTEWDFWMKLSFNTSANNFARVYLVADHTDLKGDINGYYLQVGGSNDSVEFVRQNGTVKTVLLRGSHAFTGNSVNMIRVKVIHDVSGAWHLLTDNSGNSNFTEEGSCFDNSITLSSFFGLYCRFTSSNATKFYFDDFYIGPVIIDSVPPDILSIIVETDSTLTVRFSEPVDPDEAENTSNYSIPGHGSPYLAERDPDDLGVVHITFENRFTNGSCDTLLIMNMMDLHGNKAEELDGSFCFYEERSFDVVISEIMADPTPQNGLPDAEYAELYNRTQFPIVLRDWIFVAGTTSKVLPDVTIQANGFLTLTKGILLGFYGPSVDLFTSASTLTNDGTTLVLKNNENKIIHSVSYSIDWYNNSLKENGGWSLEMIDPANPCGCMENWSSSENPLGGTPGSHNSVDHPNPDTLKPYLKRSLIENDSAVRIVFSESIDSSTFAEAERWTVENNNIQVEKLTLIPPAYHELVIHFSTAIMKGVIYTLIPPDSLKDCSGNLLDPGTSSEFAIPDTISESDIIINEILPDPYPYGERFIELFNRSDKILDLKNLVLLDPDTVSGDENNPVSISDEGFLVFPGKYIVLTKDPNDIISRYRVPDPDCFIQLGSMPVMSDDEGTVIIARKYDLEIIDKVTYKKEMNFPLLASPEGVSLERINPSGSSENSSNWHSAAGSCGYATPGYQNSQNLDPDLTENMVSLTPEIFSPDNDGKDDILFIRFNPDRNGYVANIAVYSSSGKLVKQLVRNEIISQESFFIWDGSAEENYKAAIGIHIIWIELFTSDGTVKHFKIPVVLAGRL